MSEAGEAAAAAAPVFKKRSRPAGGAGRVGVAQSLAAPDASASDEAATGNAVDGHGEPE